MDRVVPWRLIVIISSGAAILALAGGVGWTFLRNAYQSALAVRFISSSNESGIDLVTFQISNRTSRSVSGTWQIHLKDGANWIAAPARPSISGRLGLEPGECADVEVVRCEDMHSWRLQLSYALGISRLEKRGGQWAFRLRHIPFTARLLAPKAIRPIETAVGPEMRMTQPVP